MRPPRGTRAHRRLRRRERLTQKTNSLLVIADMVPRQVYAELLWYAERKSRIKKKHGWTAVAYKEIYGVWPPWDWREEAKPERPSVELETWIVYRPKRDG